MPRRNGLLGIKCLLNTYQVNKKIFIGEVSQIMNFFFYEKKSYLVPKVVIDLLFEGSRKYRRRERVPKPGSRREEYYLIHLNDVHVF